jgi:hypothetical protein
VNRRKLIGLVAALLVAAVGTLVVLKSSGDSAPAPAAAAATTPEALVKVLKVTKQIPKGTPVAQLAEYTTQIDVKVSELKPNTAASLEDFGDANMVANADLFPDDQVSKLRFESATKLNSSNIVAVGAGEATDETTLVGVWVNLPPLNALNGNLKPGVTKVAVFALFEPLPGIGSDPTKDVSTNHMIAHQVPVLDMYPPPGIPVAAPAPVDGQAAPAAPALPASIQVKLGLDPATAERVVFAQVKGSIYLGEEGAAVVPGDIKVIERGNVYEPTQNDVAVKSPTAPKPLAQGDTAPAVGADPQAASKPSVVPVKPATPTAPKPLSAAPELASATPTPVVVTPAAVK